MRDRGLRHLRWRALWDRVSDSLFVAPAATVVAAAVLAQVAVAVDQQLDGAPVPGVFASTVDNARTVLATIAGATITAASVVLSLTLVAVQLSSSQFSPRTLSRFLGDRLQHAAIGLVLGTFTYCLLVMRVVRNPGDEGGAAFVPRLSVAIAVLLGLASLLALIASINRTGQSLRVESVVDAVTDRTIAMVEDRFGEGAVPELAAVDPVAGLGRRGLDDTTDVAVFGAPVRGWVQQLSATEMAHAVPEGTRIEVVTAAGSYLNVGQPVAYISPIPPDADAALDALGRGIVVGERRTLQQDVAFGIVQLVDIAARALSPGVNDPHTAHEVLARLGSILIELAVRDLTPASAEIDGRTVVRTVTLAHDDYFVLAIEPIRRYARRDPQTLAETLRTLRTVIDEARRRRPDAHVEPAERQAELLLAELGELDTVANRDLVVGAARALGWHHER